MRLEDMTKPRELTEAEKDKIYGKLIKRYDCGCVEREGPSRGWCSEHWGGYFVGIVKPENKAGEPLDCIEDDFS